MKGVLGFNKQAVFNATDAIQMDNWLHCALKIKWKQIFFILSPRVWKNNGLLIKNYCDDLDIIDQGHTKHNCAYISTILKPISTRFRILTRFRKKLWNRGRQQKNLII